MDKFLDSFQFVDDNSRIKGIIEGILFAVGEPIRVKEIALVLNRKENEIREIIYDMMHDYSNESRGLTIIEFEDKVQLGTKAEHADYIRKIIKPDSRQNLSQAALETLSIIAYKQPITKVQIEEIRGVRSERPIATLMENGLVKEDGRLETTGRPILYSTTENFLKYFGFKSIEELPQLIEFNFKKEEE